MRRLTVVEQSILEPCQSQFGRFFYKKKKIGFGESILTLTHVLPKGLVGIRNEIRKHSMLIWLQGKRWWEYNWKKVQMPQRLTYDLSIGMFPLCGVDSPGCNPIKKLSLKNSFKFFYDAHQIWN